MGVLEYVKYCIVEVPDPHVWQGHQCFRKRGHGPDGLYCRQHAKMVEQDPGSVYMPPKQENQG